MVTTRITFYFNKVEQPLVVTFSDGASCKESFRIAKNAKATGNVWVNDKHCIDMVQVRAFVMS